MWENCFEGLVAEINKWHSNKFQAEIRYDSDRVVDVYICAEIMLKGGSITVDVNLEQTRKIEQSKMTARLWGYKTSDPEIFIPNVINILQIASDLFQLYGWMPSGNGAAIENLEDLPDTFELNAVAFFETLEFPTCINDAVEKLLNLDAMINDLSRIQHWLD